MATSSGARMPILGALAMVLLMGMVIIYYLPVRAYISIIDDKTSNRGCRREFNPRLVSVESSDAHKSPVGAKFRSGLVMKEVKHDGESNEEHEQASICLNAHNFDTVAKQYDILLVKFFVPWCQWSMLLKPSWEEAAKIIREKYDPETEGHISLAEVDCTIEWDLCRRNHVYGYPSILIFRKGSSVRWGETGQLQNHEGYYGDRDTDSLVKFAESLVCGESVHSYAMHEY